MPRLYCGDPVRRSIISVGVDRAYICGVCLFLLLVFLYFGFQRVCSIVLGVVPFLSLARSEYVIECTAEYVYSSGHEEHFAPLNLRMLQ